MSERPLQQVFIDSTGKRWRWVKSLLVTFLFLFVCLMTILTAAIINPPFPAYLKLPPLAVQRSLPSNQVLLVFDDGPDSKNTTKILATLNQQSVPAVFLISGYKVSKNDSLLQKIIEQGHEIGNGGYVQSKTGLISGRSNRWGLNTTQILIAGRLGIFTRLSSESIEVNLDPKDWPSQTPGQFARHIVEGVAKGQNVILLHQGWGSETMILALPTIVETLKNQGFVFVTASQGLGVARSQLMPLVSKSQKFLIGVANFDLSFINKLVSVLLVFGLMTAIFGIVRIICIGLAALYGHYHRHQIKHKEFYPSVAVIVPGYNEAKVIERTVNSLLQTNYPKLQIIIVDDGSEDGTYKVVADAYGGDSRITCLTKTRSGKANSINLGLGYAKAEVVIIIDADTQIRSDAIYHLVQPFQNKRVGAVAGNAKVGNRLNLITKLQALEYITSQNLDRRAFAVLNCIKVVPGAIGAWRLSAIKEVGGFTPDTLAEDTDLTIKLLRLGCRIEYAEKAIAYTEAPDTIRLFMKQRFRWMYGTLQAIWKHLDILLRKKHARLGLLVIFDALVFQIVFPLFAPIMDIYLLQHLIEDSWGVFNQKLSLAVFSQPLIYYLVFLILDYLAALTAFVFEKKEDKRLLVWLFLQRFVYRQLLYIISIRSILTALKGGPVGWNKLDRKATVRVR